MSTYDVRQDLRPLFWGNVSVLEYALVMLTRAFNAVQRWRQGAGFPAMLPCQVLHAGVETTPAVIEERQVVFVRSRDEIAATLKNSRTKGLWFDPDMVRFSGQQATVRCSVSRVIHEATGKMVAIKTPCFILEDVVATGEFLRLCPQHEYIFWRDAWLRPIAKKHVSPSSASIGSNWQ